MNKNCPVCGDTLLGEMEAQLEEWKDGWLELVGVAPTIVPHKEVDHSEDGPPPVGGLYFCSETCRDNYVE
jgi:hypothetical protein